MKAVISGAGISGLANARCLADAGWDVLVIERAAARRTGGYMMDFFGPGFDTAGQLGLLPLLNRLSYDVEDVTYVDRHGKPRAELSYSRIKRALDGKLLSIMRPDLEWALLDTLPESVEVRYGTTIESIRQHDDGVHLTCSDGTTCEADLLVSAEGIHSDTRARIFGPEERYLRYLGFHTAAFTFTDPQLNEQLGTRFSMTDTVNRQAGLYALRGAEVAAFTVHRNQDPALPANPRGELRRRMPGLGWLIPRALQQCPPEIYYDQVAQTIMPSWHQGRVVLAGDAAHAVSLLAGQGASLAIAGAATLASELDRCGDIDSGLDNYEQIWRPQVEEQQQAGRQTASWFVPSNQVTLLLRRSLLRLMSLPSVQRYVSNGLTGRTGAKVKA